MWHFVEFCCGGNFALALMKRPSTTRLKSRRTLLGDPFEGVLSLGLGIPGEPSQARERYRGRIYVPLPYTKPHAPTGPHEEIILKACDAKFGL